MTGTINFATNSMTLDQVTLSAGEGQVRINSLSGGAVETPPTPVIATPAVHECVALDATPVQLDASGTSDLEGGPLRYLWSIDGVAAGRDAVVDVELALGAHEVKLTAADSTLGRASTRLSLEVVDTTPPVWGPVEMADLTSCDAQVDRHALVVPEVTDGCTGVAEIEAWLVEADGVSLLTPVLLDIEDAVLPKGQSTVRWVARDGAGNEAEVYQTMRVGPAIIASSHLELRDRIRVLNASGAEGAVASVGEQRSTLGVQSRVAEMLSFGPIFLQNNAVVTGRAASRGAIDLQHGAFAGVLQPNSAVDLGVIPWLAPVSGATFDGADVTVPPDSVVVLTSADNGRVQVASRARLVIDLDEVRMRELWIEPDAVVELGAASPRLVVRDRVVDRGSILGVRTGQNAELFVLGTEARFERPVRGLSVVAPNARVTVSTLANESRMGLLVGDVVEVQPDVTLWCDRGSSLPTE